MKALRHRRGDELFGPLLAITLAVVVALILAYAIGANMPML